MGYQVLANAEREVLRVIDPSKKYRTRDGREVRIYAVHDAGKWCVHGAIKSISDDLWWPHQWTADGLFASVANPVDCSNADLIEVKPEVTARRHVSVSSIGGVVTYDTGTIMPPASTYLGAIDVTHDGETLLDVRIVK